MRPFELRHLHAFIAVAEELSFRAASERLYIAQPAISRTIQQLEAALGVQLLVRSTRSVQLTEAGRYFLTNVQEVLADLDNTVKSAQCIERGEMGELFVGFNDFSISDVLPSIIHRFRNLYPDISVNLVDATSTEMIEMLHQRQLDVAFPSGVTPDASLEHLRLRREEFVCICPRGHPLSRSAQINLRQLQGQAFVMGTDEAWKTYLAVVLKCCEEVGFTPRIVQRAVHSDGIINLVAAGVGITVYVEREWLSRREDIEVRKITDMNAPYFTNAVWRRAPESPALERWLEVLHNLCDVAGSAAQR